MARAATTRTRAAAKPAPEPEVIEDDFEDMEDEDVAADTGETEDSDDELEDVEDEPTEKPKRKAPVRPKIDFGSNELAAHVTETTGENYSARDIRMLLRKMAKDGTLPREVGVDRARYEFSGVKDPIVVAVVKMVTDGTAKALKQEGLQTVKDNAAKKKAAAKAAKEAAAAESDEDFEDADEEETEEAKPAPKRTARKAAPAAPAKATPATTRRRPAAK